MLLLIRVCLSLLPLQRGLIVRVGMLLIVRIAILSRLLGRALLKLRNMIANIGVRHLSQLILPCLLDATIRILPVNAWILQGLLLKRIYLVVGISDI